MFLTGTNKVEYAKHFSANFKWMFSTFFQALLKISVAFLNKKIANIPDIKTEGSEEKW